jgi:RNA polymerase sigma-70 factor (ECF subfamily)
VEDMSASVEAEVIAKESMDELEASLGKLDDMEKRIIVMRHVDELKNTEIAKILGVSAAQARMKLFRAIKKLAKIMGNDESGTEE